jgi:hypothetical protein
MGMAESKSGLFVGNGLSFRGFALAFGLVLLVLYGDLVLGYRTLYYRDFGLFGYPLAFHHRISFWSGEMPLWNPYSGCGLPFLAQWNTLALYPGSLIYLLLPLPWGLNLYCVLHMAGAGLGMYWLAWRWAGDRLGACVAGMTFGLGGLLINSLMWPNNIAAFSWMPWVVLASERACRRGGRWVLYGAVLGGVQMLTGAPEIILLTWVVVAVVVVTTMLTSGWRVFGMSMLRLSLLVAVIVALAAAQLAPFLELLTAHSHRTPAFEGGQWALRPSGWANLILPLFQTTAMAGGITFQTGQGWTNSFYAGIGTMFLALCAAAYVRDRRVRVMLALAGAGYWLALGDRGGLLPLLETFLIPLRMVRFPVKYIVLTGFALPLLAAYGMHWWFSRARSREEVWRAGRLWAGMLTVVIGGLVWIGFAFPKSGDGWVPTLHNGWSRVALLGGVVGCLAALYGLGAGRLRNCLISVFVALLALDQWTHEPDQNPTAEPRILAPMFASLEDRQHMQPLPRIGEFRGMTENQASLRVFALQISDTENDFLVGRLALAGNINLVERIPITQGFFSLYHREANFLRFLAARFTNVVENPLFDLMGVSQITRPGTDLEWLHRTTAVPFLTVGRDTRYLSPQETVNLLVEPDYEPHRVICIPEDYQGELPLADGVQGQILEAHVSDHGVEAVVDVDRPALLRIGQSPYPHWRAKVDGQRVSVLTADFAFQAVPVPAGRHRVVLHYFDGRFAWGLVLAWLTVGVCTGWLLFHAKRTRTGSGAGRSSARANPQNGII